MTNDNPNTPAKMKAGEEVAKQTRINVNRAVNRKGFEDGDYAWERALDGIDALAALSQQQAEPVLAPQAMPLTELRRAMQTLSDTVRNRFGVEGTREKIKRAMLDLQTVHMALATTTHGIGSDTKAAAVVSEDAKPLTYSSTQATKCAGCGQHKHTPLRIDAMDGYVCLTCIDNKLGELLGEFGYPEVVSEDARMLDWLEAADWYVGPNTFYASDELYDLDDKNCGPGDLREAIRAAMSADGAIAAPGVGEVNSPDNDLTAYERWHGI